jgi:thiamine pyrophosphate-dependent acetolactate synthase large subunit-like protein
MNGKINDNTFTSDQAKADVVVVMGTSLQVAPLSKLIPLIPSTTTKVLINRESLKSHVSFDIEILGDCDDICQQIQQKLWPPDDCFIDEKLDDKRSAATVESSIDGSASDITSKRRRMDDPVQN